MSEPPVAPTEPPLPGDYSDLQPTDLPRRVRGSKDRWWAEALAESSALRDMLTHPEWADWWERNGGRDDGPIYEP